MHVIANRAQVAVAAALHDESLVTSTEEMTAQLVPEVELLGVNAQQPLHSENQVGLGRLRNQMEMIAHQAIPLHLPLGFAASLAHGGKKSLAVTKGSERLRIRLRVCGPVEEDVMVFGQAPCSAGRKKWRHGAYLYLLPAPEWGESDITAKYVARFGDPEPGEEGLDPHTATEEWLLLSQNAKPFAVTISVSFAHDTCTTKTNRSQRRGWLREYPHHRSEGKQRQSG